MKIHFTGRYRVRSAEYHPFVVSRHCRVHCESERMQWDGDALRSACEGTSCWVIEQMSRGICAMKVCDVHVGVGGGQGAKDNIATGEYSNSNSHAFECRQSPSDSRFQVVNR